MVTTSPAPPAPTSTADALAAAVVSAAAWLPIASAHRVSTLLAAAARAADDDPRLGVDGALASVADATADPDDLALARQALDTSPGRGWTP